MRWGNVVVMGAIANLIWVGIRGWAQSSVTLQSGSHGRLHVAHTIDVQGNMLRQHQFFTAQHGPKAMDMVLLNFTALKPSLRKHTYYLYIHWFSATTSRGKEVFGEDSNCELLSTIRTDGKRPMFDNPNPMDYLWGGKNRRLEAMYYQYILTENKGAIHLNAPTLTLERRGIWQSQRLKRGLP